MGGAIIDHVPSVSAVFLDFNGRLRPDLTQCENEAGQARLEELLADEELLKELQDRVNQWWQGMRNE